MKKLLRGVVLALMVPVFFVLEAQVLGTYFAGLAVSMLLVWVLKPEVAVVYTMLLCCCYINALVFGRLKSKYQITKKQQKNYTAYHNVLLFAFIVAMFFVDASLATIIVTFNATLQAVIWFRDYTEAEDVRILTAIFTVITALSPIACIVLFFYSLWGMNITSIAKILITAVYYVNMYFLCIWQERFKQSFSEIVLSEYAFRDVPVANFISDGES